MNKELADLLDRLDEEAAELCKGSYAHSLCADSVDTIRQMQKLVEGGDVGRKVMSADLDNKSRLVGDHQKKLDEALSELEEAVSMAEMYKEDNEILLASNAELTALLTKKTKD